MGDREKDENAIEFDFHYCAVKLYVEIIKYCCRISEKNKQLLFLFEKSSFFSASNCQGELPFCFLSFSYFLVVKKLFPPSYLRWSPEAFPFFFYFVLQFRVKTFYFFFCWTGVVYRRTCHSSLSSIFFFVSRTTLWL
jgi:hypothetical protein